SIRRTLARIALSTTISPRQYQPLNPRPALNQKEPRASVRQAIHDRATRQTQHLLDPQCSLGGGAIPTDDPPVQETASFRPQRNDKHYRQHEHRQQQGVRQIRHSRYRLLPEPNGCRGEHHTFHASSRIRTPNWSSTAINSPLATGCPLSSNVTGASRVSCMTSTSPALSWSSFSSVIA